MPRPKSGYFTKDGRKVPGTTTITGRFKDSGALIWWANQCGLAGKTTQETLKAAGDAGSCGHEMIDCHTHGKVFDESKWPLEIRKQAEHAFLGYLEWAQQTNLKLEASEVALVSERHLFGGTFDASMISGQRCLLDYKSSGGIYTDMLIQVAGAYSLLWQEHYPDKPLHGIDLLRISKPKSPDDPVSFHHHHWSAEVFAPCQRMFLLFREAYDLDKRLKSFL